MKSTSSAQTSQPAHSGSDQMCYFERNDSNAAKVAAQDLMCSSNSVLKDLHRAHESCREDAGHLSACTWRATPARGPCCASRWAQSEGCTATTKAAFAHCEFLRLQSTAQLLVLTNASAPEQAHADCMVMKILVQGCTAPMSTYCLTCACLS